MASLTIKAIEKSFSSYFADANIKNRTKHDAMQNVANRLNMRSHKGKKVQFHITEGDGAKWDSCCNADVRDQIENVLLEQELPTRMASVLGSCRSIPAPLAVVKPFFGSSLRATTLYWARLST